MNIHTYPNSAACGIQYCRMDSFVIGMNVMRIIPGYFEFRKLEKYIITGTILKPDLIYLSTSNFLSQKHKLSVCNYTGNLCATNIKYTLRLSTISLKIAVNLPDIATYDSNKSNPELDHLACECNFYSHLKNDTRLRSNIGDKIYSLWMHNCIAGKKADKIFVLCHKESIRGMVACFLYDNKAYISLIAVDQKMRKRGIGSKLIHAVVSYAIERGCDSIEVVTQQNNFPARMLYEKCGFKPVNSYRQYHLWPL
jgi:ribosomal protein S18 acetylase RimI-like enzyme